MKEINKSVIVRIIQFLYSIPFSKLGKREVKRIFFSLWAVIFLLATFPLTAAVVYSRLYMASEGVERVLQFREWAVTSFIVIISIAIPWTVSLFYYLMRLSHVVGSLLQEFWGTRVIQPLQVSIKRVKEMVLHSAAWVSLFEKPRKKVQRFTDHHLLYPFLNELEHGLEQPKQENFTSEILPPSSILMNERWVITIIKRYQKFYYIVFVVLFSGYFLCLFLLGYLIGPVNRLLMGWNNAIYHFFSAAVTVTLLYPLILLSGVMNSLANRMQKWVTHIIEMEKNRGPANRQSIESQGTQALRDSLLRMRQMYEQEKGRADLLEESKQEKFDDLLVLNSLSDSEKNSLIRFLQQEKKMQAEEDLQKRKEDHAWDIKLTIASNIITFIVSAILTSIITKLFAH